MSKETIKQVFNSFFEFQIGENVRHKGDTKGLHADMGLLVLERHLIEEDDSDGEKKYGKAYLCRMIRFSGSGDLARFNEKELMSTKNYEEQKLQSDKDINEMISDARMVEKEVMELFDISKEEYFYEVVDGKADTSKKFRMSGFRSNEDGVVLLVTESLFTASTRNPDSKKMDREQREWTSKNNFTKV